MSHSSPLEVVQAQLDAYNAKDIEALGDGPRVFARGDKQRSRPGRQVER